MGKGGGKGASGGSADFSGNVSQGTGGPSGYVGSGTYGPKDHGSGFGGGGSMVQGSGPLEAAMQLAKMGDPRALMAMLFNKSALSAGGHRGPASVRPGMGLAAMSHAAAGTNMNIRGGLEGSMKARPSVQSTFNQGGSSFGQPAPARAGARTQQQQDHDAYFERRRQKEQMDMEMAQKLKMLSALGVGGGLPNQVSEYESTGQLYNNAGQHKVMPIETRRTRDVTPQERAQFYQSIFGR